MLGKGLESLIPSKNGTQQNTDAPQDALQASHSEPQTYISEPEKQDSKEDVYHSQRAQKIKKETHPREESVFQIEVEKIKPNPHQPRKDFAEGALKELADSIREFGIIQPLVVTKKEREIPEGTDVEYELIAGERRLMAAKLVGLPRVPAIVRIVPKEEDRLEMAIIENLQREDLNPLETARAFARLQDEFRLTQREIATRLGKSREAVANTLRLLDLPSDVQDALTRGEITESHGRLLLSVEDVAAQQALFKDLVDRHLTTRELRAKVEATKPQTPKPYIKEVFSPENTLTIELKAFQEKLSAELGAPVTIHEHEGSGKITISFFSEEELEEIVKRLGSHDDMLGEV